MMIQLNQGIRLNSGAMFDYNDPSGSDVAIEDIAHALSHVCRFSGHVDNFYSVAQHAVNCSYIVEEEFAFDALMHDTAEAFTNDIPTPLKMAVPAFKELEERIERAMSERFNFTYPSPGPIKLADLRMLKLEKDALLNDDSEWAVLDGIETDHLIDRVDLASWPPGAAKTQFMLRYEELSR